MFITKFYAFQKILHDVVSFDVVTSFLNLFKENLHGFTHDEIDQMRERLVPSANPQLSYRVDAFDSPERNAEARLIGNECQVRLFSGLWSPKDGLVKKGDKDELAAIIGHEMAHCDELLYDHQVSRIKGNTPTETDLLDKIKSIEAGLKDYLSVERNACEKPDAPFMPCKWAPLMSLRFWELRADYVGMVRMSKAGYDPEAAIRMWKRMAVNDSEKDPFNFYDHLSHAERAEFLQSHLTE